MYAHRNKVKKQPYPAQTRFPFTSSSLYFHIAVPHKPQNCQVRKVLMFGTRMNNNKEQLIVDVELSYFKWVIIIENDDMVHSLKGLGQPGEIEDVEGVVKNFEFKSPTNIGSDLSTNWPFTDAKWIKPQAKIHVKGYVSYFSSI